MANKKYVSDTKLQYFWNKIKNFIKNNKPDWNATEIVDSESGEVTGYEDGYILNKPAIKTGEGENSIVEGYESNVASGNYSHAEGAHTTSSGTSSHAEGSGTIASSASQHVQGKYNIEDTAGTYAHIVGNGTSSTRSNAHTLDWQGNGWYAGKLTVGSAPTNNMDVATKQYVDTSISGITDTNTTYSLSIVGNIITLTGSNNTISSVTLPIYNGEVST